MTEEGPDEMDGGLSPARGGGIVPPGPSPADSKARLLAARAAASLLHLPAPLLNRLHLRMQRSTRPPTEIAGGTPISEQMHGGVPTTWLAPELRAEGVVVFLHGGSYSAGPLKQHWAWLAEIQRRTGTAAAMILYRMPPRHPFPRAFDDVLAAIRAMRDDRVLDDGGWILGGDSAGGGLALAAAHALRDAGDQPPAGLLLTAPWVDLALEHPDVLAQQDEALVIGRAVLRSAAEHYANGVPLNDPRLSPVNAPMGGLAPVHLNVGTRDVFLPDIQRLRTALDEADVPVTYIEQEGAAHTYPQQISTPEAEWTIRSQVRWITEQLR